MPKAGVISRIYIFLDVVWATFLYGGAIDDYFLYNFYQRSHAGRRLFNVWRKRRRIINICNRKEDRVIFNNKAMFNSFFAAFIQRDWLNTQECSFAEFADFAGRHPRFFAKPVVGSFGAGARIVDSAAEDLQALFSRLAEEKMLVEEIIQQHREMAEFHPASVNSFRVMTLMDADGVVKVKTASLRYGNDGRCADNLFQGGIVALLDIATGLVVTTAVDVNSKRYVRHPFSDKAVVGFKAPFWNKILATATAAAKVVPSVRYVGWDVAVGAGGEIIIVEGNCAADADLTEMPDQIGKWPLYRDELRAIKNLNKKAAKKYKGRNYSDKDESALHEKGAQTAAGN